MIRKHVATSVRPRHDEAESDNRNGDWSSKRRKAGPGWRNRILRWAIFAFGVILAGVLVLQFVVESEDVGMPPLAYAIVAGLMGLATWYELMGTGR